LQPYFYNDVAIAHFHNVKPKFHIDWTTTIQNTLECLYKLLVFKNRLKNGHTKFERKLINLHNKCFFKWTLDKL